MKENIPDLRYLELAEKWLNGTITPEEEQEYLQWYNSFPSNEALEVPAHIAASKEGHRKKILRQINSKRRRAFSLHTSNFYRVAAALLVVVAGSLFWLLNQKATPSSQASVHKNIPLANDIMAGTTGAVLTLSSGQAIVLDTAADGPLITMGNARIVKENGTVAFTAPAGLDAGAMAYNILRTPRARQHQLVLADGTKVWLNAESSIRFPTAFNSQRREVEITGEAYFEVAKNPSKPFVVHVNDAAIEVLGTHFNVMAYPDEPALETTLLEGAVQFRKGARSVLLRPGQQSRLIGAKEIKLVPDADVAAAVAWKNGMQAFDQADIKSIMRQVARWYDVEVQYSGNIPWRTFSGEIPRSAPLSELLKLLKAAQIQASLDAAGKKITITP